MGFSDILLAPFRRLFCPPLLSTPFSTIKMPPLFVTTLLCGGSFAIIASGVVFCFVTNMPMVGFLSDGQGKVVPHWISPNGISHQFLAEGIIASMTFTLGAGALLAAFYEIMKEDDKKSDIDRILTFYGYSGPLWPTLAMAVFRVKLPQYFPTFVKSRHF
jgi:hypothetical protein